jgi:hypothetical protein
MRSGRCPPHDAENDARRTCATLLVDLEVHQRLIMRIPRHADVSMTLEIYANARADGDARSAARAEGSPFDAQVDSRLRCCIGRILLLYWRQGGPHQLWYGPLTCGNTVGVTGFEPAVVKSRA